MDEPVQDAYEVLGVGRTASPEEIKKSYRELIRQVHPDLLATAPEYWKKRAAEKAADVNEAHRILSDPTLRRQYDAQLDEYNRSHSQRRETQSSSTQSDQPSSTSSAQQPQSQNSPANGTHRPPSQPTSPVTTISRNPLSDLWHLFWNVWAIWSLFWCGFWISGTYSRGEAFFNENKIELLFSYAMAYISLVWTLWIWRKSVGKVLSRFGIMGAKNQIFATSSLTALSLFLVFTVAAFRNPQLEGTSGARSISAPATRMLPASQTHAKVQATTEPSESEDRNDYGPDKDVVMTGIVTDVFKYPDFELKKRAIQCESASPCWYYVSFEPKGQTGWALSWYGSKPTLNAGGCAEMHVRIASGKWESPAQDKQHLPKLLSYQSVPNQNCDAGVQ